jgi:hypothetical protein
MAEQCGIYRLVGCRARVTRVREILKKINSLAELNNGGKLAQSLENKDMRDVNIINIQR